jgi:competence protein ComEC
MLTKISALSSWQWQHGISQLWIIVIAMAGILLLFSPVKMYKRWFGFLGFLPLFFYHPASPALGEIYLTVLDVGQGLSVVIQTKQHTLVYDTGAKLSDNFDLGESVVAPYLRTQTISHLDTVILSHGDNDHIGGAAAVLSAFPTTTVLTAVPPELLPLWQLPAHLHLQKCIAGQKWQWDGVDFTIFNSACVLKITTGKNSILLTGDIEKADEKFLLQNAAPLHSTILLAPHHGSANSSTPDFVAAVAPQFVLFSTGYLNRFHFPNAAVVARYQQIGAQIYNTAFTGAIIFKIKPHASMQAPQLYRLSQGHFWNFPYK